MFQILESVFYFISIVICLILVNKMISFRTSKEEKIFLKRYAEDISKLVKEDKVATKALADFESEMNVDV